MSPNGRLSMNTAYTRAVSLERDLAPDAALSPYIPTKRSIDTLSRVVRTLGEDAVPRAWTLVGPYGSGKSAFGVFLARLLSRHGHNKTAAIDALSAVGADDTWQKSNGSGGYCSGSYCSGGYCSGGYCSGGYCSGGYCAVVLTGSPEPLSRRLVHALRRAATDFWAGRRGKPKVLAKIAQAAKRDSVSASELAGLVDDLCAAVVRAGCDGLLILIDELGKFLEFEARHFGANDVFLLQALAERSAAGGSRRVLVVTMLHQAFEQYAQGLGERQRAEWTKVQGRFEVIPFIDASEQVLKGTSKNSNFFVSARKHRAQNRSV
ncbi:MAG: hypothetical protein GKR94_17600 [Gammaproteobacteria bacterium]|nr:hypothetical protein [Gammaproteobacteria bacterium]